MIKLKRRCIPDDFASIQQYWTSELFKLIVQFGSYSAIPKKEKDVVVNNYNLTSVKKQLQKTTNGKCSYCESYIDHVDYPHIEHFFPKSIHPKFTFKWSNFLLSCGRCNIPKGEFDTKINPFINPYEDNPEEYLCYKELRITTNPISPDPIKSNNTIIKCDLKRTSLYRQYSSIRIEFNEIEDELEEIMNEYSSLIQLRAKILRVTKILNSLDNLKTLCDWKSQHAGYVRYITKESLVIENAIKIINNHLTNFGFEKNYELIES